MALLFCDSFDHYTNIGQKWNGGSGGIIGAYGRNSTNGLRLDGVSAFPDWVRKTLPSPVATVILGTGVYFQGSPTAHVSPNGPGPGIIVVRDGTSSQVYVDVTNAGKLRVVRGGGTVLATGATTLLSGVYYYVELKVTINGTTGSFTLRINNTVEVTGTNVNTQATANATADNVVLNSAYNSADNYVAFDDLVICDASGVDNNDFLGDVRVQVILPNGAGTTTAWTPNAAGANYTKTNETPPDDDTTYVSSATPGQVDTYAMGNLLSVSGVIKAVQSLLYARKDDAGVRTIAPVFHIGVTDYVQANLPNLSTTYAYSPQVLERSPATAAAWTVSEVNGMEFGVKEIA